MGLCLYMSQISSSKNLLILFFITRITSVTTKGLNAIIFYHSAVIANYEGRYSMASAGL